MSLGAFVRRPDPLRRDIADLADYLSGAIRGGVCTNSSNDYTLTFGAFPIQALAVGDGFIFSPTATNTGASTLKIVSTNSSNVSTTLGPYNLKKADGSVALEAGNLFVGRYAIAVWDGTQFQLGAGAALPGVNSDIYQLLNTAGLGIRAGGSTAIAKVGGAIFDHYASATNSGTAETDLYSDTLPASLFGTNGDKVDAMYAGTFVSSGTATRQIRIYHGGNLIFDTGALTLSLSAAWVAYMTIIRDSSSSLLFTVSMTTEGAALAAYTAYNRWAGYTLSNTQILKITGTAAGVGAGSNQIFANLGTVSWLGAA